MDSGSIRLHIFQNSGTIFQNCNFFTSTIFSKECQLIRGPRYAKNGAKHRGKLPTDEHISSKTSSKSQNYHKQEPNAQTTPQQKKHPGQNLDPPWRLRRLKQRLGVSTMVAAKVAGNRPWYALDGHYLYEQSHARL